MAPFWSALDDIQRIRALALRMILLTGQRPGEVAHMRYEHIRDGWWEMPGKPDPALGWPGTKNGRSHRVWLPEPARAILEELTDGRTKKSASCSPTNAAARSISSMASCAR